MFFFSFCVLVSISEILPVEFVPHHGVGLDFRIRRNRGERGTELVSVWRSEDNFSVFVCGGFLQFSNAVV